MTSVSVSQLKTSPARIIKAAEDYPVAIQSRNKTEAYVIGRVLFDRLEAYIEDFVDGRVVDSTDFSQRRDFEEVAKELGI